MVDRCEVCRFWRKSLHGGFRGVCHSAKWVHVVGWTHGDGGEDEVEFNCEGWATVYTGREFGCIHWEGVK